MEEEIGRKGIGPEGAPAGAGDREGRLERPGEGAELGLRHAAVLSSRDGSSIIMRSPADRSSRDPARCTPALVLMPTRYTFRGSNAIFAVAVSSYGADTPQIP